MSLHDIIISSVSTCVVNQITMMKYYCNACTGVCTFIVLRIWARDHHYIYNSIAMSLHDIIISSVSTCVVNQITMMKYYCNACTGVCTFIVLRIWARDHHYIYNREDIYMYICTIIYIKSACINHRVTPVRARGAGEILGK